MDALCACAFDSRATQWLGWYSIAKHALTDSVLTTERAAEIVSLVEGIQDRVTQAKHDTSNMRLVLQLDLIKPQAVEFEQSQTRSAIKTGALTLDNTLQWLESAQFEMSLNPSLMTDLGTTHRYAIVKLIFPEVFGTPLFDRLPETMRLDAHRLLDFRRELVQVALGAATLAVANGLCERIARVKLLASDKEKLLKCVLTRLNSHPEKRLEAVAVMVSTIVQDCSDVDCSSESACLQLRAGLESAGMVPGLFMERVGFVLWRTLSAGGISTEYLTRRGLLPLAPELMEICERVANLVQYLELVYLPLYRGLLLQPGEKRTAGALKKIKEDTEDENTEKGFIMPEVG
eukprot:TRINITY_DN829_c0_g1_i1.p1 TRINITY_DN829_c0_g1~~TRINITY_DN829_c0_g1_i1.p1  ORF type:complete len:346 (+),score=72.74 TRINITY_DN829_c0_g1_i1:563-1600(+)